MAAAALCHVPGDLPARRQLPPWAPTSPLIVLRLALLVSLLLFIVLFFPLLLLLLAIAITIAITIALDGSRWLVKANADRI